MRITVMYHLGCTRQVLEKIFKICDSTRVVWDERAGRIVRNVRLYVGLRIVSYSCIVGPRVLDSGLYSVLYSDRQIMWRSVEEIDD